MRRRDSTNTASRHCRFHNIRSSWPRKRAQGDMALGMTWKILGVVRTMTWELQDRERELRSRMNLGQLQA